MLNKDVTIIDYGMGNLLSVSRAFEYWGASIEVTGSPDLILKAKRLVLPGVGAFSVGMEGLKKNNIDRAIKKRVEKKVPLLGICLGMQMLMEQSEEFGSFKGLGLIPGKVVPIPNTSIDGITHKIPYIGWNKLELPKGHEERGWADTLLSETERGARVYFVHSYTAVPDHDSHRLADSSYNGRLISAAICKENIYGMQFHPEKSGKTGLTIIKKFLELG